MKIKLIKESTGFGYNTVVANWIAEDQEHLGLLRKFMNYQAIEVPENVARGLNNAIDVETGRLANPSRCKLHTAVEKLKPLYMTQQDVQNKEIKKEIKKAFKPKLKKELFKEPTLKDQDFSSEVLEEHGIEFKPDTEKLKENWSEEDINIEDI